MSFLNPLFLLGGLAVAVPILLHLIRRHNAQKVEFPTLIFLRRIDKKTIRYQKLRHLLLLLLRVFAFLLLVFAFMRPYRKEAPVSAAVLGQAAASHILALDNSMSMRYQDRWDRAKAAAADIVRASGGGDRFAVLEFSDVSVIRSAFSSDKSAVLGEIENIPEPGDQPTRYVQALRVAERMMRETGAGERTIHLISDFQKSGLTDDAWGFQLGAGIRLQYVDLGSDAFSNLAIQNVRTVEEDKDGDADSRIQASIVAFGDQDRANVRVALMLDGRKASEKTVSVAKNSREEIEFSIPGLKPGEHSAILELDDPELEGDNRFYMTIDVREKTPVVVVEKTESRGRLSSGFFLDRALNINRLSPYRMKTVSPQDWDASGRLLVWNDVAADAPAVRNRLEAFVKSGGAVIVVLGESTKASDFNRGFGAWLPVKMEETSPAGGRVRTGSTDDFVLMTDIRTDHPIFQPFGKPNSGTFSGARFYSHARIVPGDGAETLARFDNGDPTLVSIGLDQGRVLVFTSSADDSGNDLPLKAVYAPFWQQMLRYLASSGDQRNWLETGDIIDPVKILSGRAFRRGESAPDPDAAVAVLDPAKQRLDVTPDSGGIVAEKAGFYDIRTEGADTAVAVNTVAAESDLTHQNAEEMTATWISNEPAAVSGDADAGAGGKDKNQHIWIFLFLAALLFLISESLLSGNKAKSARSEDYQWTARNA
jgi:hypothetical protein